MYKTNYLENRHEKKYTDIIIEIDKIHSIA